MKRGWGIALGLILAALIIVLVAVKFYRNRMALKLKPPPPPLTKEEKKVPSMLRALPFKKKVPKKKPSILVSSLKKNQVLLVNLLANPKKAPKGLYLRLALVVTFPSDKLAGYYKERKAKLEQVVVDTIQELSYQDLRSSEGPLLLKEALNKRFQQVFKGEIKELWITGYEFQKIKGL